MSEHNQKHLTLSNRTYIEQELLQKSTFSSIGEVLHKDPSTISKEVKRYSETVTANQKGRLEKNHEYIRYVIPKVRSMHRYIQDDINLMTSHINSTARDSLNGATPFDMAALLLDAKIPALAGQVRIPADDVCLKPSLIEDNVSKRNKASMKGGDING